MPYDLPAIATRSRDFRPITPNATDQGAMLRLLTPVLQEWRDSAARSMAAYAAADITAIEEEDNHTAEKVALSLLLIRWDVFFGRMERWHRGKWLASVQAATGVDAKWMTEAPMPITGGFALRATATVGGVVEAARRAGSNVSTETITKAVKGAVASARSLASSLSDEARSRNRQAIIGGLRRGAAPTEVARDINAGLTKSKRRAVGVAENEVDNFLKAATKARMAEAGLDFGKWDHLAGQKNPRLHHLARNGQLYRASDPILAEMYLPHCHCTFVPVLKLRKFSGI